jgi:hypothetical protein
VTQVVDVVLAENLPAAQLRHVEAPAFGKYLPAMQSSQAVLMPCVALYLPAGQSMQPEEPVVRAQRQTTSHLHTYICIYV